MQTKPPSLRRLITWITTLAVIAIFAVFTWKNNERLGQQVDLPGQISPALTIPDDLGNYDTIMANDRLGQNNIPADYYMLALSWSPSFCEEQRRKHNGDIPKHLQLQCNQAATFGWVIHGLWPQNAHAQAISEHPRFCQGDLPALPQTLIKQYLPESPGANLLQGQWEKHGACAFSDAESYFAKQKALFRDLNLPADFLSHRELFQWMKQFNPSLRHARLSARKNELYICYDKQWNVIDCR
ncbi:MAG: ribonuclease [Pasteurellaceae bacterium]|nr:ribonuclease [Pasteurellaceae bacterium]